MGLELWRRDSIKAIFFLNDFPYSLLPFHIKRKSICPPPITNLHRERDVRDKWCVALCIEHLVLCIVHSELCKTSDALVSPSADGAHMIRALRASTFFGMNSILNLKVWSIPPAEMWQADDIHPYCKHQLFASCAQNIFLMNCFWYSVGTLFRNSYNQDSQVFTCAMCSPRKNPQYKSLHFTKNNANNNNYIVLWRWWWKWRWKRCCWWW